MMDAFTTEEVTLGLNDSVTSAIFLSSPEPTFNSSLTYFESTTDEANRTFHNVSDISSEVQSYVWAVYNLPSITFLTLNLLIGVAGNSAVIYVYGFCLKATPMNSFVVNLAVLDIITCGMGIPLMILHDALPGMLISNTTCKLSHFIYSTTIIASGLTLVTIALDRYRRICRPLSTHLSVTQVRITAVLLVTVSALTCIPVIVMAGAFEQLSQFTDLNLKFCYLEVEYINSVYSEVFYSYKSTVILLTIIITISCYFRIWFDSKIHTSNIVSDLGERRMSVRAVSVQPKIKPNVKKMFMITLLFILSFLPSITVILVMMSMKVRDKNLHPLAISFVNICRRTYLVSCSLNPFICWYCNDTFRLHVRYIISNWLERDHPTNSVSEASSSKQNDLLDNVYCEKIT